MAPLDTKVTIVLGIVHAERQVEVCIEISIWIRRRSRVCNESELSRLQERPFPVARSRGFPPFMMNVNQVFVL